MNETNIVDLCKKWGFDIQQYKETVALIGDVCAIRRDKSGKSFRRNYERALVVLSAALHYKSTKFLEFGTGRGFVTACATLLDGLNSITTIDKLSKDATIGTISKVSIPIDMSKINFISKDSKKLVPKDIGAGYDLVFIDGEHSASAVANDFALALECTTDDAVIIFDDFRNKHRGVKKFIASLEYTKTLVPSDGWVYKNRMIKKHGDADKVKDNKEIGSGQVVLWKK